MNRTRLCLLLCLALVAASPGARAAEPAAAPQRIVFLGDSITDGDTYPLLIRQALAEAKQPVPVCIDAGIGGDTAAGMRRRIERDVLVHHPTRMTLSAGINDVLHGVKPADYERDVKAILDQLKAKDVPVLILTTTILGPKHAKAEETLAEYNAILHRLAEQYGCRVAEVNQRMQEARKAGANLIEEDSVHPNYAGHRLIARAVLDALGYPKVAVPETMTLEVLPGTLRTWEMRPVPKPERSLDEEAVRALRPDDTWKTLTLPEKEPVSGWWNDQERQRGFAQSLAKLIGPSSKYQGIAHLDADQARTVYFNPGAYVETIWLNGKRIYKSKEEWLGWHAGRERIAAELQSGRNTIVIETGSVFFLSVTDNNDW